MKENVNYKIIWTIIGIILLVLITVIGLYLYNFHDRELSKNPEEWGQFGDYIGGTLNTTIAILNLVLITYLTVKIAKIEEDRVKNNSKDSVRPLGLFSFEVSNDFFKIELHNVGLGPLILKKFVIFDSEKEYINLKELIDGIPLKYRPQYSLTTSTTDGTIIRKDDFLNIINMRINENTEGIGYSVKVESLKKVKDKLATCQIKIIYADLFGNIIKEEIEDLELINTNCG